MNNSIFCLILLLFSTIWARVPFSTVYVEIEKIRYEGDLELLNNPEKNADKLDKLSFLQKIWVDVTNNSVLIIEEPGNDNDQAEKSGRLKYNGIHYTLDYSAKIALDETETNKIYDNYTSKTPDYKFYEGIPGKKVLIKSGDGQKRKTNPYQYFVLDQAVSDGIDAAIEELKSSDMPDKDKELEIKKAEDKKISNSTIINEWIWVDDQTGEELIMFIRKTEQYMNVKTTYLVNKVLINEEFDSQIFEKTLSEFKVKKM